MRRILTADILRLVVSQALYYGAVSVDLTLTALAGLALAPTPFLATLPLTLITAVGLVASVGTGLLASRWGYRRIMALGAVCAVLGGLLSVIAVVTGSFWLLCLGTAMVGAYRATGGYIRFLAADLAPAGGGERALSIVMYGGLLAAFVGPFAALAASTLLPVEFAGSYLLVAAIGLVAVPLALSISREPVPSVRAERTDAVRAREVRGNRDFVSAMVVLPLAAALMTLVMVMGPLANAHAGHGEAAGAAMVQWHLVGMFAPAIFSGELLRRWGPTLTAIVGCGVMAVGAASGVLGTSEPLMIAAMIGVGVGWNLLFLAGSAFLLRCYESGRGARLQAWAEGVTGVASVLASLLSASIFAAFGWQLSSAPVVALSIALALWLALYRRSAAPISAGATTPVA